MHASEDAARTAEVTAAASGITGAELGRHRVYQTALWLQAAALVRERARLAEEIARQREVLRRRRREERQLEILGAHARERTAAAAERATTVLLDDLAVRRRREGR